jgi:hypothetical protein
MEPALIYNQQVSAKIQIKSIKNRFKEDIVDKVISGKYLRVITMLSDNFGRPSWVICHNILHHMLRTNAITSDVYTNTIGRIQDPNILISINTILMITMIIYINGIMVMSLLLNILMRPQSKRLQAISM